MQSNAMKTSDFYYDLPQDLIAQHPMEPRDHARMMVCSTDNGQRLDTHFFDLPKYLRQGDVLVINQTKVIPARLLGQKEGTGVPCELLLLKRLDKDTWEALVRPGRRLKPGAVCVFGDGRLKATVGQVLEGGARQITFSYHGVFEEILDALGEMPLPPYIHEKLTDKNRYQTVYAKQEGSAAAPTAGLHFTEQTLAAIRGMGIPIVPVLLHVGLGTFRPVKTDDILSHHMHEEYYEVSEEAAAIINRAKQNGGRVVAVGTTSVRTLETCADEQGMIHAQKGNTGIFIYPGIPVKCVDVLLTNFHLPESTLLMLVSAIMGKQNALAAYEHAVRERYRFFSFGDCMLIGKGLLPSP